MPETDRTDLDALIDQCMLADRRRLRRRLRGGGRRGPGGRRPDGPESDRLAEQIERSREKAERRRRLSPTPAYPDDLPIAERRDEIREAIEAHQVVVVCGETGSGKTTQLPKICLELGRGVHGLIGHTQPRRIAARTVAQRIASELGTKVGSIVGSKVRFGDQTGPDTLVKLMTDGILLAETQGDRRLEQYDTIIIDEAHERSLNIDFLIGYLRELLPRRPDLKVIITSATIDPERFAEHFDGAPIISVSGRTYPVEVHYRPREAAAEDGGELPLDEAVLDAVGECLRFPGGSGDVLVFLPGEREIRDVARALGERGFPRLEILPLYARLSWAEQARVFASHPNRRVVLATNVAETSLTVPNIRFVIDSGLARLNRYSARSRVQRLPVEAVSQASAEQRKGRCGRVGPGVCLRLYAEEDFLAREEHTPPEIVRTNLASVVLQMKALRLGDVTAFPFIDPPDHRLVRDGYESLHELDAVDDDGELTDTGRKLARLPIDPRVGRMLLDADRENCLAETLVIAAALSIQDPRERPHDKRDQADAAHEEFQDERSDFMSLLALWKWYRERERTMSSGKLRRMCAQKFLSYPRMREWGETHHQIRRLLSEMGVRAHTTAEAEADAIHRSLLVGLLSNVGRLREDGEYEGAGGKRFRIHPGSGVFGKKPKWIIAAELVRTTKLYARSVARIDPGWIEELAPHLLRRSHSDPWWDAKSARVLCRERVSLFGLEVIPKRSRHFGPIDPEQSRRLFIHHALVEGEFTTRGRFFAHNAELLERVRTMQAKGRRTDLLADTTARYAFFDRLLPEDVYSGQRLEKWRRAAEKDDPEILFMGEGDLVTADVADLGPERFPDLVRLDGNQSAPITYRFDPAAEDDGATLIVPVETVGLIDEHEPDWFSRGIAERRVEALIRAAPKEIRRRFTPAPEWAARCVEAMGEQERPLEEAVADTLSRLCGVPIDPSMWANAQLPEHVRVNIRAVDEKGEVVAESRDVAELRRQLGSAGRFRPRSIPDAAWDRDDVRAFPFDELPRKIQVVSAEGVADGYPALLDAQDAAQVRVLADAAAARRAMREGARRLAVIGVGEAIRATVREHPRVDEVTLRCSTMGGAKGIERDLVALVAERSCFGDDKPPRTRQAFEAALDRGWNRMSDEVGRAMDLLDQITAFHQAIDLALEKDRPRAWQRTIDDVDAHLGSLFAPGFLLSTPHRWLGQYPRYLKAIALRLDRLRQGGAEAVVRDGERMDHVGPYGRAWADRRRDHDIRGLVDPQLEEYRWMVEEYRVSIFAQELGVAVKVSPQRLRKQWGATRA